MLLSVTAEQILQHLNGLGILPSVFDLLRVVNPLTGQSFELLGGKLVEMQTHCYNLLGRDAPCENCISHRAMDSDEQLVKIETYDQKVMFIISMPILLRGERRVLELIKDISSSVGLARNEFTARRHWEDFDQLSLLVYTDALTGLRNRRFISDKLPGYLRECGGLSNPLCIALIDVDGFKPINDQWGHQAGDRVLEQLGVIFRSFVRRDTDFAARYGGDEFLLCFPGTPLEICRDICERLRDRVESTEFSFGGQELRISISVGVAESCEVGALEQSDLIALADRRMYTAKRQGRNQVVCEGK